MDHRHPGIHDYEAALDIHAKRGRRIPATLDADLFQFGGEAFRGLRAGARYKDRSAGMLVCASDRLQRRALTGPGLSDHNHKPLIGTRDPDRSLLLAGKLATTLGDAGREESNLGAHERLTNRLAAKQR
jgi:hypothetical protein